MDIAEWLQDLGLERYAPAFRDNDVDGEVLPELTADDLISIGVTSVGHRRELLAAIAALGAAAPAKSPAPDDLTRGLRTPPPPEHLADKIRQARPALEGERKRITVLFADVKGSMNLAERFDPEQWFRLVEDFFQVAAAGVHRFEGTVNQFTGDGMMALFGAPITHEDHAHRACLAACGGSETKPRRATNPRTLRPRDLGTPLSAMWASAAKLRMLFIVENQPGKPAD